MSLRGSFTFFIVHSKWRKFLYLGGFPLSHAAMKYPEVKAVVGHVLVNSTFLAYHVSLLKLTGYQNSFSRKA